MQRCQVDTIHFLLSSVQLLLGTMLKVINVECNVTLTSGETYNIILALSRLDPLKSNIILILTHIAPQTVSGTELTKLLGYSPKARTIYRGVLDELEQEDYIVVNRTSNQYSIGIDQKHPIMKKLYELIRIEGGEYTNQLLNLLGDE